MDQSQRALLDEYNRLLGEGEGDRARGRHRVEAAVSAAEPLPGTRSPADTHAEYEYTEGAHETIESIVPRAELPPPPMTIRSSGSSVATDSEQYDTHNLSILLDDDCNKLKRDVLDFFTTARARMMEHEASAVEKERREWMRNLTVKQEEIDTLSSQVARKDDAIRRLNIVMLRAVDFRANTLSKSQEQHLKIFALTEWKLHVNKAKDMKHKLRQWGSYYVKTYVVGRVFKAWRSSVHHNIHESLRHKYEEMMELERAHILAEQVDVITSLRTECEELSQRLQQEEEGRQALEEQMKKAFMRGVCALNLEAMSLMKSGHPPAGVNPFHQAPLSASGEENVDPSTNSGQAAMSPQALGYPGPVEGLTTLQARSTATATVSAGPTGPHAVGTSSASAALERFLAKVGAPR